MRGCAHNAPSSETLTSIPQLQVCRRLPGSRVHWQRLKPQSLFLKEKKGTLHRRQDVDARKVVSVVTSVPNFEATSTQDVSLNWSNYVLGDSNP